MLEKPPSRTGDIVFLETASATCASLTSSAPHSPATNSWLCTDNPATANSSPHGSDKVCMLLHPL